MVKQTALTVLMKCPDVFATRLASLLAKLQLQILSASHEWLSVTDAMTVTMAVMKVLAGIILCGQKGSVVTGWMYVMHVQGNHVNTHASTIFQPLIDL